MSTKSRAKAKKKPATTAVKQSADPPKPPPVTEIGVDRPSLSIKADGEEISEIVVGEKPQVATPPPAPPAEENPYPVKYQDIESVVCPQCQGSRIEEINAGLISRWCRLCNGTGLVPKSVADNVAAKVKEVEEAAKAESDGGKSGESGSTN